MEWVGEDSVGEDSQKIQPTWPPKAEDKWDRRFLHLATDIGGWSKDPSTKVGCVLVRDKKILSTGYNGFPAKIKDDVGALSDRSRKYKIVVHAEINAIANAALHGVSTDGSVAYMTMHPCSNCTSAMLNAGISKIVCYKDPEAIVRWRDSFQMSDEILQEAGVPIYEVEEHENGQS